MRGVEGRVRIRDIDYVCVCNFIKCFYIIVHVCVGEFLPLPEAPAKIMIGHDILQ